MEAWYSWSSDEEAREVDRLEMVVEENGYREVREEDVTGRGSSGGARGWWDSEVVFD